MNCEYRIHQNPAESGRILIFRQKYRSTSIYAFSYLANKPEKSYSDTKISITVIDILQSPELYYLFRTHHNSDSAPEVLLLRTNCLSRMETRWKDMLFSFITSCLAPCQSDGNHVRVRRMSNTPSIRSTIHSILQELTGCSKPVGALLLSAERVVQVSPDAFRTTSTKAAVAKASQRHFQVTCTSG